MTSELWYFDMICAFFDTSSNSDCDILEPLNKGASHDIAAPKNWEIKSKVTEVRVDDMLDAMLKPIRNEQRFDGKTKAANKDLGRHQDM